MTGSLKLCVVIPLYNEERNIESVFNNIIDVSIKNSFVTTIVAVNDGSTDRTKDILFSFKKNNKITIIENECNKGYSSSLASGIKASSGDNEFLLIMDGDNQFRFESILSFIDYIDNFDVIVGERSPRNDSIFRIILGKVWSLAGRYIFNTKITDLNCGFKLFRTTSFKNIQFDTKGPGFNLELFSDPSFVELRIKTVEIPHYPRLHGAQSGVSLKTLLCCISDFFLVFRKRFFKF